MFRMCHAFQAGMASIVFDETEIVLNPTCALFVTMEAPRAIHRKIPDNFKVVTCMLMMWIVEVLVISVMMVSLRFSAFPKYCHASTRPKNNN